MTLVQNPVSTMDAIRSVIFSSLNGLNFRSRLGFGRMSLSFMFTSFSCGMGLLWHISEGHLHGALGECLPYLHAFVDVSKGASRGGSDVGSCTAASLVDRKS